jgi:hypothetical protein
MLPLHHEARLCCKIATQHAISDAARLEVQRWVTDSKAVRGRKGHWSSTRKTDCVQAAHSGIPITELHLSSSHSMIAFFEVGHLGSYFDHPKLPQGDLARFSDLSPPLCVAQRIPDQDYRMPRQTTPCCWEAGRSNEMPRADQHSLPRLQLRLSQKFSQIVQTK